MRGKHLSVGEKGAKEPAEASDQYMLRYNYIMGGLLVLKANIITPQTPSMI